jgi:hypothetical protein
VAEIAFVERRDTGIIHAGNADRRIRDAFASKHAAGKRAQPTLIKSDEAIPASEFDADHHGFRSRATCRNPALDSKIFLRRFWV